MFFREWWMVGIVHILSTVSILRGCNIVSLCAGAQPKMCVFWWASCFRTGNFPTWLVVDEGEVVHVTLTPADALVNAGMCWIWTNSESSIWWRNCIMNVLQWSCIPWIPSRESRAPFTSKNFIVVCIVTDRASTIAISWQPVHSFLLLRIQWPVVFYLAWWHKNTIQSACLAFLFIAWSPSGWNLIELLGPRDPSWMLTVCKYY